MPEEEEITESDLYKMSMATPVYTGSTKGDTVWQKPHKEALTVARTQQVVNRSTISGIR